MGKLFGLSIFINMIVTGIVIGKSRKPIRAGTVGQVLLYFFLVYLAMGFVLTADTEFLRPE